MNWTDHLFGFDLETTSVDPYIARPVSIATIHQYQLRTVEHYEVCDPCIDIPENAKKIHGISNEDVKDKKKHYDLMNQCSLALSLLGNCPVVGMNVRYDLTIANRYCAIDPFPYVVDILIIDRHYDKYRKGKRTLEALAKFYEVEQVKAHFALDDVRTTLAVLKKQIKQYRLDTISIADLHTMEREWYLEWLENYQTWRKRNGIELLDERTYNWPIG